MKAFVGVIFVGLLTAAPVSAGSSPPSPSSWTGCYVGAGAGAAWDDQNVSTSGSSVGNQAPVASALSGSGGVVSIYGGCNWQFAPTWMVGFEADVSWADLNNAAAGPNLLFNGTPVGVGGISWSNDIERLGSVRGRLGYVVAPDFVLFATGGYAWAQASFAGVNSGSLASRSTSFNDTFNGFVVGGGAEWAPWHDNWVVRLEYLRYEFSETSSTVYFPNPNSFYWDDLSVDTVRAGLGHKF